MDQSLEKNQKNKKFCTRVEDWLRADEENEFTIQNWICLGIIFAVCFFTMGSTIFAIIDVSMDP